MPIRPGLFSANALFGDTSIRNGYANVTLSIQPFALEGNISFFLDLRTDSTSGTIVASTSEIKLVDLSSFVSFVANTYTISEGQDVLFTLTTTNAANNAVLYYTIDPQTANLNAADFFGAANSGSFLLVNDVGTILLNANADLSQFPEHGETFKVQVRTASVSGNIVATSDNVVIQDTSNVATFFISPSSASIVEGSNVTFTITSLNVTDGTEVFYTTVGNVRNYNFVEGNTGSFIIQSGANSITLTGTAIPPDQLRQFNLQIREGSTSGPVRGTSQNISILDSSLNNMNATGGTIVETLGYKTHIFTSSANLVVTSINSPVSLDLLLVAGGGGGGRDNNYSAPGGGAGGMREITHILPTGSVGEYTMTVGAGGASASVNGPGGNPSNTFGYDAAGGGRGAANLGGPPYQVGGAGGSGGGGSSLSAPQFPGASITGGAGNTPSVSPPQGNPGGNGKPGEGGGGGGGAGATGGNGFPIGRNGGIGGDGRPVSWMPASYGTPGPSPGRWFAGGGGASQGGSGIGGAGGGGAGNPGPSTGTPGTIYTGGGGGGGGAFGAYAGGTGGSGIIAIRYQFNPVSTYSLTSSNTVYEGDAITFSLTTTNVSNNYVLYYRTRGNVVSSDFITSNTGSITVVNNSANLILTANSNLTAGQSKDFVLEILEGAVDGDLVVNSNTVLMIDNPFILATGGTTLITGGYKIHTFSTSGNLTISSLGTSPSYNTVDYLVVAGGGGGGGSGPASNNRGAGGGGAGGLLTGNTLLSSTGTIVVSIGAGGAEGTNSPVDAALTTGSPGLSSNLSGLLSVTTVGGGGGGRSNYTGEGLPGGSGGGAGAGASTIIPAGGGSGTPGQGYPGGASYSPETNRGGGGGGAGGSGYASTSRAPPGALPYGGGGAGISSTISGSSVTYASGGAGSGTASGPAPAGPAGTGNGGGGGQPVPSGPGGYAGAPGIVIIRYPYS